MSLRRYANARDANEPAIVAALERIGASVERLDTPVDLLVGWRGRNYLLEVKLPAGPRGGKSRSPLTSDQGAFVRAWGGQVSIVRGVSDALAAVGATGS